MEEQQRGGNIKDEPSFVGRNRAAFKEAHARFSFAIGWTHALGLAFHRSEVPLPVVKSALRDLHRRVDEQLLGRRFYRLPPEERTLAMFNIEGVPHNVHVHSLWRIPKGPPGANRLLRFHRMFAGERGGVWNDVVPSGTCKLTIMTDHAEAARYMMKEQHMGSDDQLTVWSTDFGPTH